jgi:hypothetical protein
VIDGVCADLSIADVAVVSDATGTNLLAPVLTTMSDGFFVGQTGTGHAEARCPGQASPVHRSQSQLPRTWRSATRTPPARVLP